MTHISYLIMSRFCMNRSVYSYNHHGDENIPHVEYLDHLPVGSKLIFNARMVVYTHGIWKVCMEMSIRLSYSISTNTTFDHHSRGGLDQRSFQYQASCASFSALAHPQGNRTTSGTHKTISQEIGPSQEITQWQQLWASSHHDQITQMLSRRTAPFAVDGWMMLYGCIYHTSYIYIIYYT